MLNRIARVSLALMLAILPFSQFTPAQTASNAAAVSLSFTVNGSLTVAATPGAITFTPTDASHATASGPISVTTSWNLQGSGSSIWTVAYFSSSTAALTDGTANIPASSVFASINGGAASACTLTNVNVAAAKSGATCPTIFTANGIAAQGTNTGSLLLSLSSPSQFLATTYNGVITISASAT